ncbi:hypothetical protein XENOCAPTIV_011619 [Xenoophorus captivus]|uniref:Uncharacterized protein n=1 Tax=Xenoophorus captivus TaxID=1517983 RepID=A0ABV0RAY3_9TELE
MAHTIICLTIVQQTTTDTLDKEGKSLKVIKKLAVQIMVYQKLSGRKNCDRNRCTDNRFTTFGQQLEPKATAQRRIQDTGYNCCIPWVKPLFVPVTTSEVS